MKLDHHLFCSELCHKDYLAKINAAKNRPYARYAFYVTAIVFVAGIVYFALFVDAFYNGGDQPTKLTTMAPSLPVLVEEPPKDVISISRPLNGVKSASQIIEVEGRAPENSVVAMYLNGSLIESTVVRQNTYTFPQVLLTKHANVIQTRYYSNSGSSNFSPAIMVFFQDAIRSNSEEWRFFQNSPDNISRGNLTRRELALTFDGGSEANSCINILDALKKYGIHATFFLTGEFVEKFPELTKRIAAEQEVGNHTYSHQHLTTYAENFKQQTVAHMTREELQSQLRKTEELYFRTTGRHMLPLWRAPYGEHNLEIRKWAAEIGYTHVAWTANSKTRQNMDSLDWVPDRNTPGYFPAMLIKDRILSFGQNEEERANGAIVLMHLGSQRKPGDRLDHHLPEIIETFKERGYDFIPVSKLIDHQDLLPNLIASK